MTFLWLAVLFFAATNIDDLFLLIAWFSQKSPKLKTKQIVLGQVVGFSLLLALSLIGSMGALIIPSAWVGLLGAVPIYLGIRMFIREMKAKNEQTNQRLHHPKTNRSIGFLSPYTYQVAAVTFANGGDNIGVYIPFFSSHSGWQIVMILLVFYSMIALWCYAGYKLVHHPLIAKVIQRYGHLIIPFILVGLGFYIFLENDTFSLFRYL
ncbi:cadmium resistance transport/sequestration family protein [Desmospora activa DSM 45169]|uniref:Cadmium resistance transport/sequestration family protein n=2 Tax=Desmospora TaxID=500614 RepID=A0A2T4ZCM1_9BACL|nr:cadmium resistance transport/sequestration family protein [Desmospora activa DSM 45169]